jgi:hypothetical protein
MLYTLTVCWLFSSVSLCYKDSFDFIPYFEMYLIHFY